MSPSLVAFLPAHGLCLSSQPAIVYVMALSNLFVAAAYLSIPAMLYSMRHRIAAIPLATPFVMLFAGFIALCGISHVFRLLTLYVGGLAYYLDTLACLLTAMVSTATAVLMWRSRHDVAGMCKELSRAAG